MTESEAATIPATETVAETPTATGTSAAGLGQSGDELRQAPLVDLIHLARDLGVENPTELGRRGLVFRILASQDLPIVSQGILEILPDGFGFLRGADASYLPDGDDVYVSPSQIRRFGLLTGDTLTGIVRPPRDGERYYALVQVEAINHADPEIVERRSFYDLTPTHPVERFRLEHETGDVSTRILDMLCPIGKGQRALIVSPPRAGKTVLMKSIAHAIVANHPETVMLVLLVDERPEEVTEMTRSVQGEVISSTFDEPASRHVQVAELVIRKARRLAEQGRDVVIMLDSITRLARAYNTVTPSSGRVLSGGVDASALHKPKRFFGSARALAEGGSLTIIATALIETGSRMDDVIFEEFKGTGNAEIVLERKIADKRIWPAIDINRSGTRKEELLLDEDVLTRLWMLRKILQPLGPAEAMQMLVQRLDRTASNAEFLEAMKIAAE
jgi:transcription termination factor Rho